MSAYSNDLSGIRSMSLEKLIDKAEQINGQQKQPTTTSTL